MEPRGRDIGQSCVPAQVALRDRRQPCRVASAEDGSSMADRRHRSMSWRQRKLVFGLLCLVMAQSPARVRASPELAALIARDSISDIAGDLGMGALSGSAASPAGSGGDATAAYMASMGAAGGSSASQTSAGQPAAAPTGGRPTAVVKTDQQAALQSTAKQHALSEDKQRASADVAARPLSATAPKPPILLIHGGAQGGWVWRQPQVDQGAPNGVVGMLEDAGYLVYAPTLPYHEPGTGWSPSQGQLQAQDYVDYIINFMVEEGISDAVVVGHSVSGVWLQLLLGQAPERISRMVFINAIILKNGESFISNAVGPAQLFFTMMFTYPDFPQALSSAGGAVDLHVWKNVMISLESANQTFAVDTYNRLVPEPAGPQLEYPDFTAFYNTPMPKVFIFEEDDVSLLIGKNRWLDFAARLREANNGIGNSTVIAVHGDHQGMLTRPVSIAEGILEAAILPLS